MSTEKDFISTNYALLGDEDDEDEQSKRESYMEDFTLPRLSMSFKISSLSVGLLVGFLVQMTTLGANVVIWEVWGDDFAHTSKKEIVVFSLMWSFVTSAIAIITLGFLRALMSNFFLSLPVEGRLSVMTERVHEQMLECMEILFVIGALVGVSLAWVVTDMLLGMKPQVNFSLLTLAIALLWCKAVFWFRNRAEEEVEDGDSITLSSKEAVVVV